MEQRVDELVRRPAAAERTRRPSHPVRRETRRTVVVGAGPTGLSAAYHLGPECVLLEAEREVGGWCRSIHVNGFTFDFAGHIMFSNDPYVHEMYSTLLGENVHWQDREAWIYSKQVYTRYPFQAGLYGLPAEVVKECLLGAIEARLGPSMQDAKSPPSGSAAPLRSSGQSNGVHAVDDCCADGILESTAPYRVTCQQLAAASANGNGNGKAGNGVARGESFEQFIYRVWGAGIARHFAIPYNQKLWATPLAEMETSWLGGRVPLPDLGEMLDGALKPAPKPMGPNARFGYPLHGDFSRSWTASCHTCQRACGSRQRSSPCRLPGVP
jgi:UDP-galactopyranose mutase